MAVGKIVFQVINGSKRIQEDSFEEGCLPDTARSFSMDYLNNKQFSSITDFISTISSYYGLSDTPSDWEYSSSNSTEASEIELLHNILEDDIGCTIESNSKKYNEWKDGKIKAWCADYVFFIRKLQIEEVEFKPEDFVGMTCSD